MGEVDAVVEDSGLAEYQIFRPDAIGLLGVFSTIEPREVCDGRSICKMGNDALLTRSHGEGLETEDMPDDLHKGHLTRQFVNLIDLRAVYVFIRIVFEQVAVGLDAKLVAQHLLAVRPYAWQVFDVLIEDVQG